ncbi:MAG TPA: hypothetical protein VFH77_07455 [Streptomyces sp.]|nr:hypothetical protein [Streptomyces sp.]
MDYCARCRRHLNGALACPGCGAPAAGPQTAARTGERYYRAKPFFETAPAPQPPPEQQPEPEPAQPAAEDDPPTDAADTADTAHEAAPAGHRAARAARRGHGRRARPRHRVLLLVLAACLGTALLGVTVSELGAPGLPWSGPDASGSDTQSFETGDDASQQAEPDPSGSAPSADASQVADTSEPPTTPPSPTASDAARHTPAPAPTRTAAPDPTPSSAAPTPTHTRTERPHQPPDQPRCWLIFCSS